MPPVNQGSRGTLITWMVVTSIISVVAATLAIYFYIDSDHSAKLAKQQSDSLAEIITPDLIRNESEEIEKLRQAKNDPARGLNNSMKLFDVALAERATLAKMIGSEDEPTAVNAAHNTLEKAKAIGLKPANESLTAMIDALVAEVKARQAEAENNKNSATAANKKLTQVVEATDAQIKSMKDAVDHISAERDQALDQAQKASQGQTMAFDSTAADLRKQLEAAQTQINELNAANADVGTQMKKKDMQIADLLQKLGTGRVDAAKNIARQPDGKIVRVPGGNRVFIDLGNGDHISPGLTFEVYDKSEGIPPAGDPANDDALPMGKASIEVISVLPNGSECRIIRQQRGSALVEGDVIGNLVYDKHQKYNFVVYGTFDVNQTGQSNPQDAEVIKRLITQWGGKLVDKINVDTDFVILGKEPTIPEKPADDDAIAIAAYNKAVEDADQYANISQKARDYRLPILNQNRFLYMVGYYSLSNR